MYEVDSRSQILLDILEHKLDVKELRINLVRREELLANDEDLGRLVSRRFRLRGGRLPE